LESAVTELAEKIAGQPPIAVRRSKRAIDQAGQQSLGEGLGGRRGPGGVHPLRRLPRGRERQPPEAGSGLQERLIPGFGVSPGTTIRSSQPSPRTIGETMSESSTEFFRVRPNGPLEGEIKVSGATKNSGLKQLGRRHPRPGVSVFHNMPPVLDATVMIEVMRALGATVEWAGPETLSGRHQRRPPPRGPLRAGVPHAGVGQRPGPLLGGAARARVALPGGDAIGSRRLDMHIRARGHGGRSPHRPRLYRGEGVGAQGRPDRPGVPSVGATENLMTAAVLAKARRSSTRRPGAGDHRPVGLPHPHGARSRGGTSTIEIDGVDELVPVEAELMADRIEAGTLLMACGIAGGEISLIGPRLEHIEMLTSARRHGHEGVAHRRRHLGLLPRPPQGG